MLLCLYAPQLRGALGGSASWEELLDALDALTPSIDDRCPGLAFLDMRGVPGDPARWGSLARERACAEGIDARIGFGANPFVANVAAILEDGCVCAPGEERAFVAPMPLDTLDIEENVLARLRLLGLERLGDVARLPHGPFVRRFGTAAAIWHERACGVDRTPFLPRAREVAIEAAVFGEGRTEDETQVFFALRVLLARVCGDLERAGKRAGGIELEIELDDGDAAQLDIALAAPTADENGMLDVLRAKLEGRTFSAAIVGLRVRAIRLEEGGEELALFASDDIDAQAVAVTLARLEASMGEPVRRALLVPAHPLEERFAYEPFRYVPRSNAFSALPAQAIPQLRLLTVREIVVCVRGGEPASIGAPPLAVLECVGPWRVEEGWFATAVARDEYDVLLEDGECYRIYHQGERWYLRGAYD